MVSGPNFDDGFIDIHDAPLGGALTLTPIWSSLVAALANVPTPSGQQMLSSKCCIALSLAEASVDAGAAAPMLCAPVTAACSI
jgi:hypothetical protein